MTRLVVAPGVARAIAVATMSRPDVPVCTCVCCTPARLAPRMQPEVFPAELSGLYSPDEWNVLRQRMDAVTAEGFNACGGCAMLLMLPLMFFIIFGGLAYSFCCQDAQPKPTPQAALIEAENARIAPMGLQWEWPAGRLPDDSRAVLVLTWMEGARPAYEAAHPEARKVSQELPPLPLADDVAKVQWALRRQEQLQGGQPSQPPQLVNGVVQVRHAAAPAPLHQSMPAATYAETTPSAPPQVEGQPGLHSTAGSAAVSHAAPKFCAECGAASRGGNFCSECGTHF